MNKKNLLKKMIFGGLTFLVLIVLPSYLYSNHVEQELDSVMNNSETELAETSINTMGGYRDFMGKTVWSDPVLSMNDPVTLEGKTRTLEEWLSEAGSTLTRAYDYFMDKKSWKTVFLCDKASNIYAGLNSNADLLRAEDELVQFSKNLNGAYIFDDNKTIWMKPIFSPNEVVSISGIALTIGEWMDDAGSSLSQAYTLSSKKRYNESRSMANKAVFIYSSLNEHARHPVKDWRKMQ